MTERLLQPVGRDTVIEMFSGPRQIPHEIAVRIDTLLTAGIPIADPDRFTEVVADLADSEIPATPGELHTATFSQIVSLGTSSLAMAWLQAGDLNIPRPRRLHEHNQSTLNIYSQHLIPTIADPRDRILKPGFMFQDGGKSLCVALTGNNRAQSTYNERVARNLLSVVPESVLNKDEKAMMPLLMKDFIGKALRRHAEKGQNLDEVVATAQQELAMVRAQCPDEYRDRLNVYLDIAYRGDAGGHTQRAYYVDAATGEMRQDVTNEDRYNPDGSETMMTLDRLFSETPEHRNNLKLHQPKHLAVMRRLFPDLYE